jgi:hypothetical protein
MSNTELNHYRVYCTTEADYFFIWSETEPTVCPNNVAHPIDTNLTTILDTISTTSIKAEEDSEGFFTTEHVTMVIPAGTPGDITEHDVSWPMDILLWRTLITPTSDMISDLITVIASPETTVGVLTAIANAGVTTISVNSTVTDNTSRGFLITLDDTVNKDVVGRCTAVDSGAGTISFETATTNSFAAGTPVKIGVYVLKDIYITDTNTIDIGSKGFKGKTITAGMILRVYYENNSGTTKTLRWRSEMYSIG